MSLVARFSLVSDGTPGTTRLSLVSVPIGLHEQGFPAQAPRVEVPFTSLRWRGRTGEADVLSLERGDLQLDSLLSNVDVVGFTAEGERIRIVGRGIYPRARIENAAGDELHGIRAAAWSYDARQGLPKVELELRCPKIGCLGGCGDPLHEAKTAGRS